VGNNTNEMIRS